MIAKKTYHVIPSPEGGWSVRKGGSIRATKRFEKKSDAVTWGREISRNQGFELFIHNLDGTISERDTYVADPYPPRDRH